MENPHIRIEIEGNTYDYPDDMLLPRIGEDVFINDVHGVVSKVCHQICQDLKAIYIYTI